MASTIPYTYLIGWSKYNKWYYGVRFAKNCTPTDLWNPYKTSSKHVKAFIDTYGEPDIIQIRKQFTTVSDARIWESKVLKRLGVVGRDDFLNKTDNISISPECCSFVHSKETREKRANSHRGQKRSDFHKYQISKSMKGREVPWLKGKKRPEHSIKMSGENHPRSKKMSYNGEIYINKKDLIERAGISLYIINNKINNKEILILGEINV